MNQNGARLARTPGKGPHTVVAPGLCRGREKYPAIYPSPAIADVGGVGGKSAPQQSSLMSRIQFTCSPKISCSPSATPILYLPGFHSISLPLLFPHTTPRIRYTISVLLFMAYCWTFNLPKTNLAILGQSGGPYYKRHRKGAANGSQDRPITMKLPKWPCLENKVTTH